MHDNSPRRKINAIYARLHLDYNRWCQQQELFLCCCYKLDEKEIDICPPSKFVETGCVRGNRKATLAVCRGMLRFSTSKYSSDFIAFPQNSCGRLSALIRVDNRWCLISTGLLSLSSIKHRPLKSTFKFQALTTRTKTNWWQGPWALMKVISFFLSTCSNLHTVVGGLTSCG